jgi:aspartate kinase
MRSFTSGHFGEVGENTIVAQGELISTQLFTVLMTELGYNTKLLPALEFMKIDEDKAADLPYIRKHIQPGITKAGYADYYITQGFICLNATERNRQSATWRQRLHSLFGWGRN